MNMQKVIDGMETLIQAAQHVINKSVIIDSITSVEPSAVNVAEDVNGIFFIDEKKTENVKHLLQESIAPFTEQIHANALAKSRQVLLDALLKFREVEEATDLTLYDPIRELATIVNPDLLYELPEPPDSD